MRQLSVSLLLPLFPAPQLKFKQDINIKFVQRMLMQALLYVVWMCTDRQTCMYTVDNGGVITTVGV